MNNCICSECIKDSVLKRFIENNGKNGKCNLCSKPSSKVMEIANREFQNRMKAAIRYSYSETLYNTHWGGVSHWIDLFDRENDIFMYPIEESEDDDSLYWEMWEIPGHVNDYSEDVSLYYGGGRMDAFILPIMTDEWQWVQELRHMVDYNNPNIIAKEISEKIRNLVKQLEKEVEQIDLFRARIGKKDVLYYFEIGEGMHQTYIPYKKEEIGAPWPKNASEGRFNRAGTAYLYLASDKETAINEIRPSVGHCISIGQFRIENKVKIVDFCNIDFYEYATSDDKILEYIQLKSIEEILSIPNPDKEYRVTQGFSDAFILLGYDGVKFRSSVSPDTYNIVLFDRRNARYIDGTHEVIEIKGLKFVVEHKETNINEYYASEYMSQNYPGKEDYVIKENFGIDARKP